MTNYRSLIPGGFYWDGTKNDKQGNKVNVSIRANNPGAVNGASWERDWPGFVTEIKYDGINNTTIFETPEQGVAVYLELLRRYRDIYHLETVWDILFRYIGAGGVQDYYNSVHDKTGFAKNQVIDLNDDKILLPFAKAQFRHEAGVPIPWSDQQILYGFNLARAKWKGVLPLPPVVTAQAAKPSTSWWSSLFGKSSPPPATSAAPLSTAVLRRGDKGPQVRVVQEALVRAGIMSAEGVDGDFGAGTELAVKAFQRAHNLDPDGEIGPMTGAELAKVTGPATSKPPQPDPKPVPAVQTPPWYLLAQAKIGFHERGENQGIEEFISQAHTGSLGDPWCAIFVNAMLENAGIRGSRSAMARSFEHDANFVKLPGPAMGAIVTNWRGSPSAGTGHVFFFDGENSQGVRGIGGNESDGVKRSFHDRSRVVGYYWPKSVPLPKIGPILVDSNGAVINTKET